MNIPYFRTVQTAHTPRYKARPLWSQWPRQVLASHQEAAGSLPTKPAGSKQGLREGRLSGL